MDATRRTWAARRGAGAAGRPQVGRADHALIAALALAASSPGQEPWSPEALGKKLLEARSLKDSDQHGLALQRLELLRPAIESHPLLFAWFCYEFAECNRLLKQWDEAHRWHRRGEQASADVPPGPKRVRWQLLHGLGRGFLYLDRGMVEEARQAILDAERAGARRLDDEVVLQALTILELRVMRLLDQPRGARRALREFEARFGASSWLRILAALPIQQDPNATAAEQAEVAGWLEAAMADDSGYGMLARLMRILQHLDRGEHEAAGAAIEATERLLSAEAAGDRQLALQALALRHVHDSGAPEAVVRERHASLLLSWRARLAKAAEAPVVRGGTGLLYDPDLLRGLDQLMRTHIRFDGERGALLALERLLEIEQLGTLARTVGAPAVSPDVLQSRLATAGRGLLVHVPALERTWVFTIDAKSIRAFELPARVLQVEHLARELLFAIDARRNGTGTAENLRAAEQALTDVLLPPAIADVVSGWSRVAICGGERTGYVPFEVLRLPDGRRLGAALPLSYLPSLVVGSWLATRPAPVPPERLQTLLVACPDATPRQPGSIPVQPLPFGAGEVAALTRGVPSPTATMLTGRAVDLAAIRANLDGVHFGSFLVHGMRDEQRVDRQGLLLGDGSVAWGDDLETLPLPPWLFLGACRAGDGRARRGDDGRHLLTGVAMLAGARVAVVPALEVAYRPTVQLLAALQEGVYGGASFDEALRLARVAVAGADGEGPLDAFLFHLHGLADASLVRSDRAETGGSPSHRAWWASFAVLGGLLLLLRRIRHRPSAV